MYLLMLMHDKLPHKSLRKYTRFVAVVIKFRLSFINPDNPAKNLVNPV